MAQRSEGDYDIGKGKPPREHTFRKGHAYHPPYSRKPKKSGDKKSGRAAVAKLMEARVRAKVDRRVRQISNYKALLMREMQKALQGDVHALVRMARRGKRYGFFDLPPGPQQGGVKVIYAPTASKEEWLREADVHRKQLVAASK